MAEAERRIEEARRTGAKILDLSDLAMRELPASLGGLQGLQSLYLRGLSITNLVSLAKLQGLQNLDLQYCKRLKDLSPLAGLKGLQSLYLQSTRVTDLAPLAGLQELQRLDLASTGVTDLAPLATLQGLQSLDLGGTGVTNLVPLARLQGLQSLDLGGKGVTDLAPLAGLQGLESLDLGGRGVTDLVPLSGLQRLQNLNLSSTGVTDLAPLAGLQRLQSLNLWQCTGVTDLTPLTGLQGLQTLNLSSTHVTNLAPLVGLQGLQNLDLSSTGVTDLTPLTVLQGLQSLNLSFTGVTDLTPLAGLQDLQTLRVSDTGVSDLAPLAGLHRLRNLYLDYTAVTDIAPLARFQRLQNLHLWGTDITDLTPLAGLRELQNLDLRYCQRLTDLGSLSGLRRLQGLSLYGCQVAVPTKLLGDFARHQHLTLLIANEAVGVPQEVLSRRFDDNCLRRLRAYISELDLGSETENEVKVILLGNGRVGKTQLCRRFRGQPFDESIPSTHGVQIWREELRLRAGDNDQVFQVNWWDFGGQDIYHGTHALFLRSRAVFLILWTPQLENREEYADNGIPLRNQPLAYWLDYVRTLAGEGSPVIVVQSKCDRFADRRPDPPRPDHAGFFECCSYSAKEDLGRDILDGQIRNAIGYLLERNGALEIGRGRAEARRRLYNWRSEDQRCKPEERQHRTFTPEEFRALCNEVGGIVSWELALDYFHHTGVVFYDPELFTNCIILDQDWALDAIYAVFHRGRTVPWLRDSGRFTREDLASLVWQEHSPEEQTLFLGLMQSCGVCFPCGKTARGETRYVAPDLLPGFEDIRLPAWKEEPNSPTLRLEYRFFHPAVIRGLMSTIGQRAGDLAEYWKYGLWFKDGRRDSQLLVQFEDTSTDKMPGAGALELKAQGRDPLGLLREIRKTIDQQRIGENPEELLTLDGTTVARSSLATVIDGSRVLDIQGKPVAAAAFAAFFEDQKQVPDETHSTVKATVPDINPQPLAEKDKERREVFISYAWGDETPEGKIRTQVADDLCTALDSDGFRVIRDRDTMRPGDRISAFIRRLTRADHVVAVISQKYLRSPYCMQEIHGLWQRRQEDPDLMAECVTPIVLPEVNIGGPRDRAHYVRYWKQQKEELEELLRELGPDLDPDSFRDLRLIRSFSQDVDGILRFLQDVLMPRKLEAHLDDGFEAVREALRRRMKIKG